MTIKTSNTLFHQYYMAQLFSNGTIKSSTEVIGGYNQEHSLPIVQKLYEDFQKGLMKNETAYEQTFNQLFFVELLGYTPNENLRPKAGTPIGGKIADVALGVFPDGLYVTDGVQVAVELKDCTVQLDKRQARTDTQTPVEQGFGYKTSFKNCGWLIVSNFFVTRLYRDNKQDYEEWTLEQLLDPTHDYFQLRKLILLLHKSRLIKLGSSESFTEKLLSQFRIAQQNITKKFYTEYKELRLSLINDIRHHNQSISVEVTVEKAQKIIDRIVFIHFCEDKGLLNDGKLRANLYGAIEVGFTPWEMLKKFFTGVDSGSEKLGIPHGYNGELFKPDSILDELKIGDDICKKFIALGDYDFDEELSVNILGHIFEQSISDIEQLKIKLLGQETDAEQLVEKTESKRKKDGIFYTPEYIVDYIVENSLMKYLSEKEDECLKKYKDEIKAYQAYQHILQNIKVVDPACGSGAFLVKVFDRLYHENERVGKIVGGLFDETQTYKNILTNNIFGVDLNPESVEITKLSLWLKSAQKGKKLNNLDKNIKCGNSLIDDPAVAGDKAFSWEKEFSSIFEKGGFDVVVGNPPYVRIQNLDTQNKKYFEKNYITAYKSYDIYMLFVEKAYKIISIEGECCYIMPKKFVTADYGVNLKKMLYEKCFLDVFIDFGVSQIFEDATTYTGIFGFNKSKKKNLKYKFSEKDSLLNNTNFTEINYKNLANDSWIFLANKEQELFEKLSKNELLLDFTEKVFQGLATSADQVYILEKTIKGYYSKATGKYYNFKSSLIKPLLRGSEIKRYSSLRANNILIFPYEFIDGKIQLISLDYIKKNHFEVYNYLCECEVYLRGREKGKMNNDGRYGYVYPKSLELFSREKILTQVLSKKSSLTLDLDQHYFVGGGTAGGYGIILKENNILIPKFLLTLLNSILLEWYIHKYASPFSGGYYAYSRATMEKMPIKSIPIREQAIFIERADKILTLNKELAELKNVFFARLRSNITENITKKIESFEDYSFKDLISELKKQKITLSLVQQDEREPYFNDYKSRIVDLKQQIQQTDTEIDNMVFDLYGLTEEERKIVLES